MNTARHESRRTYLFTHHHFDLQVQFSDLSLQTSLGLLGKRQFTLEPLQARQFTFEPLQGGDLSFEFRDLRSVL